MNTDCRSMHVCRKCGYDLTGNPDRPCPECGCVISLAIGDNSLLKREDFWIVTLIGLSISVGVGIDYVLILIVTPSFFRPEFTTPLGFAFQVWGVLTIPMLLLLIYLKNQFSCLHVAIQCLAAFISLIIPVLDRVIALGLL